MNYRSRMLEIERQRERLRLECEVQRLQLAESVRQSQRVFRTADRVIAIVRYARRHAVLVGAAVALLTVLRRRGLWSWVRGGFMAWRLYRSLGNSRLGI